MTEVSVKHQPSKTMTSPKTTNKDLQSAQIPITDTQLAIQEKA